MDKGREEPVVEIRSLLVWQLLVVLACSVIVELVTTGFFSVMLGGLLVIGSTWHVYKSISLSGGDRSHLMRNAGIRFFVLLVLMAIALLVFHVQPLMLVLGMALAYATLYVRSLMLIFRKMKGDSLG